MTGYPRVASAALALLFTGLITAHWPTVGFAANTNTAQILSKTTAAIPQCLRWRLTGICVWLKCGSHGCKVRVSPRVFNYAPDAVVTAHNDAANHPWAELNPVLASANAGLAGLVGLVGGVADASGSVEGRHEHGNPDRGRDHQTFREADLVGHPFGLTGWALGAVGLVCPPRAIPMLPYFVSTLDALVWRELVPVESLYPAALIPGLKEIGNWPANTWGNVYPRTGMALQQEEPKAGAILAQRAGAVSYTHLTLPTNRVAGGCRGWGWE